MRALLTVALAMALSACTNAGASPAPTKSLETWGNLWDYQLPACTHDNPPCTVSPPIDICAQRAHVTFPMTDEATRQRYFTTCDTAPVYHDSTNPPKKSEAQAALPPPLERPDLAAGAHARKAPAVTPTSTTRALSRPYR